MREIRQSGSEGGGNEQTVSPYSYLPFTCRLFGAACFKTEELRWGSPTATPPFEPLDLAPKDGMILPSLTLPTLKDMSSFRVSVSAYFRVIPC